MRYRTLSLLADEIAERDELSRYWDSDDIWNETQEMEVEDDYFYDDADEEDVPQ